MKELYTGTLEIVVTERGYQSGKKSRGWVTLPLEAVAVAGLSPERLRVAVLDDGKVAVTATVTKLPGIEREADAVRVSFTPKNMGLCGRALPPSAVALAAAPGRIEVLMPEGRDVASPRLRRVHDGAYMAEVVGLRGAARAIALDAGRRGASRVRALAADQAADVLREAGHRVQQLSPRLWSIDGQTASLADLAEAAHRIDAGAVLVAEAA